MLHYSLRERETVLIGGKQCRDTWKCLFFEGYMSGGTLIFSHIRRLGLFLGFKLLNFNILGGFQKN